MDDVFNEWLPFTVFEIVLICPWIRYVNVQICHLIKANISIFNGELDIYSVILTLSHIWMHWLRFKMHQSDAHQVVSPNKFIFELVTHSQNSRSEGASHGKIKCEYFLNMLKRFFVNISTISEAKCEYFKCFEWMKPLD